MNKTLVKTAARYAARLRRGERVMRDSGGRMFWPSGRPAGTRTIGFMLAAGQIAQLDADLFGDPSHGQTLGAEPLAPAPGDC